MTYIVCFTEIVALVVLGKLVAGRLEALFGGLDGFPPMQEAALDLGRLERTHIIAGADAAVVLVVVDFGLQNVVEMAGRIVAVGRNVFEFEVTVRSAGKLLLIGRSIEADVKLLARKSFGVDDNAIAKGPLIFRDRGVFDVVLEEVRGRVAQPLESGFGECFGCGQSGMCAEDKGRP